MNADRTAGPLPEKADSQSFPWTRLALAVFYALALWLVFWAVLLVAAARFVLRIFDAEGPDTLQAFAAGLGRYAGHVAGYLTFGRDDRPFPFGPLT